MTLLNTLLEITIYSVVLFGAIWLFRILLKKHLSPVMLYAVWFILIARLLMPVTITSGISFITLPTQDQPSARYTENVGMTGMFDNTTEPTINSPYNATNTTQHQEVLNEQLGHNATGQANQPTSINSKLNITWETVLISIWLIGIAVMLTQLGVLMIKLRKRIKSAQTIPAQWQGIANQLQTELGFKRSVRIVMIERFPSPALCGGIKPVIVLPCEMDGKGEESIRFALLHEMTHIKRGDHIVSMLLLLLRAVYWFNPVVWLMMKQMRLDIETACDSCLTESMPAIAKKRYAGTMLSMYAQEQIRYVLGMSMGQTKKTAERRLRGMFMRSRSSRKSKAVAIVLTTVLLVTCFTTACQPTPEKPIVVGRQEDVLEDVDAVAPEDFETIQVPKHINEVYDDYPYLSITYEADVIVPETTAYPITHVKKKKFTEENFQSYIDLFIDGDYEMYEDYIWTKDDYFRLITKAKEYEGTERMTQDILDFLQEAYDQSSNDVISSKKISSLSDLPTDREPSVYIKSKDGAISKIGYQRDGNCLSYTRDRLVATYAASTVSDELYSENMDGEYERFKWTQPGQPDISQEDAYAIALKYKDALGIDLDLYFAEPCSFITDYVDKTTGWQFMFTRTISGLQTIQETGGCFVDPDNAPSYVSPWGQEKLIITVDKQGLFGLYLWGASEISSTMIDSAKLESFDMIQQRITNQLSYLWASGERGNVEIEITEIKLGISMLSIENETQIGQYLPTWYVSYRDKNDEYSGDFHQIMFSAIDGSYVEPRITNQDLMCNIDIGPSDSSFDSN